MGACDLYLHFETPERKGENAVSLRLPVLPEELVFTRAGDNVSSSTVKHGEVNVPRKPKLVTFQVDSFFPRVADRDYIRGRERFFSPDYYMTMLCWLQDNKVPAKAVFVGFDLEAMYVTVESFSWNYRFGDADVPYSLALKEYRPYGAGAKRYMEHSALFSGDKAQAYYSVREARPKSGFSVGDRVIVNGQYYRDAYGGVAFLPTPIDFMCQNYQTALSKGIASLRKSPAGLLEQEAVIISVRRNGAQLVRSSRVGGLERKTELGVLFPFQIAVNKQALGWVSESSMRHV